MYNMSDILQICCFQDASYVKDTVSYKVTVSYMTSNKGIGHRNV